MSHARKTTHFLRYVPAFPKAGIAKGVEPGPRFILRLVFFFFFFFSNLFATFTLLWIAFKFGRDEEED